MIQGYTLCRLGDVRWWHIRPPAPSNRPPIYTPYPMEVVPLCVSRVLPMGVDLPEELTEDVLYEKVMCWSCVKKFREIYEARRAELCKNNPWMRKGPKTIGDTVSSLRDALCLSQVRLAALLGTSQAVVSWWETDTHKPSRMALAGLRRLAVEGGDRSKRVLRELDRYLDAKDMP